MIASRIKKQRILVISFLLITYHLSLITFFYGCTSSQQKTYKKSQFMMGTVVTITVVSDYRLKAEESIDAAFSEIRRLEGMMSIFKEDSDISLINHSAYKRHITVSREVIELLSKANTISRVTDGAFDITTGKLSMLWGFSSDINIEKNDPHLPSDAEIKKALPFVMAEGIITNERERTVYLKKKGIIIDTGGIAKGYAADAALAVLKSNGITDAIVAVAGDVRVSGKRQDKKLWRVGVRHPRKEGKILATLELTDRAISTSGDYERFFIKDGIRYHHILDPRTGYPAGECQSVTIIADDAVTADALATGVFVLGPEKGMKLIESMKGVEGIIVDKNGRVHLSSSLKGIKIED